MTWIRDMFQVLHRRWQGWRFLENLAMRIPSFYCDCLIMRRPSNLSCATGKQVQTESRSHSRKCAREDPGNESHRGECRGKGECSGADDGVGEIRYARCDARLALSPRDLPWLPIVVVIPLNGSTILNYRSISVNVIVFCAADVARMTADKRLVFPMCMKER